VSAGAGSTDLEGRITLALRDDFLRKAVRFTADRLRNGKQRTTEAFGRWEEWRERGRRIRAHTVAHLDYYLDQFSRNLEAAGHTVHFAENAHEAAEIVLSIAKAKNARLVAKSKSMVSEEVHINKHLGAQEIECIETDLGEWIVQLAREMPSHIIIPAIHKNRHQVQALFEAEGGAPLGPETATLAAHARRRLREKFARADIGMTGCNFAIAETGSVVLFTNEGNGRMCTTLPETHIVMMGMERILPTWDDLEVMANLLPRSATGQKLTTYVNILTGGRRPGEADGAREVHVVVLDNGRSDQLGDAEFQAILHCIRCGACLNVCPVYRQIGGHAYGSVYPGPIGAVLTPLLQRSPEAAQLANASSLCGACFDACPVKIPLHEMLVHLRRRNVETGLAKPLERVSFAFYARLFSSPRLFQWVSGFGRWVQRLVFGDGMKRRWLSVRLPGVRGWAKSRGLPAPARRSFREQWDDGMGDRPPRGNSKE
jgi:L-lactate dehydrogenase complex protein LldF